MFHNASGAAARWAARRGSDGPDPLAIKQVGPNYSQPIRVGWAGFCVPPKLQSTSQILAKQKGRVGPDDFWATD